MRLAWRVYPYVADEYFLRWREARVAGGGRRAARGPAEPRLADGRRRTAATGIGRPPRPIEAVQLSVLARATVPILERYYLAISLLLKAGSGRLTQEALEQQCQLTAQRMSMLYELNSPEFFDRALFSNFIGLLRARDVLQRRGRRQARLRRGDARGGRGRRADGAARTDPQQHPAGRASLRGVRY